MVYALLIDDDDAITESARGAISGMGLHVEIASTWDEGLAKFYAYSPDLVISDYNLPGSKMGLALLSSVARVRPSVRLVLVSAYLNEQDAIEVEKLGLVDRVIRKTSAVDSAKAIIEEVRAAASRSSEGTNWASFAESSLRADQVDQGDLDTLDNYLQVNRLGDA